MADADEAGLGRRPHARGARGHRARSAATRPTGRPTSRAASSGSRSSMAARRSATPRRAAWSGTSPTRCRSTASRSTRRGATWSPSTRPTPTGRSTACRCSTSRSRSKDFAKDFPIILTSGRLVEYEGGGDETRSNPWLAELQQNMFVEINPFDANNCRHPRRRQMVWVTGPRAARSGSWRWSPSGSAAASPSCRSTSAATSRARTSARKYPEGADPIVLGESTNTAQTYGYDSVTQMQETKTTLCRIEAA